MGMPLCRSISPTIRAALEDVMAYPLDGGSAWKIQSYLKDKRAAREV
jgi:hypothetical protein